MASPYDKLLEMISCLDLQDDGIRMNHKIKSIELDFCNIIKDEQMLSESMDYMNNKVLGDNELALKFALLFSSRNFDSLAMNDFKVRCKMLNILQTNYSNADKYRKDDKNRLYNSITLLGEYYHRVRLADGNPISILGESLIGLLTQELNTENLNLNNDLNNIDGIIDIDLKLAKLILSQVTLNGDIMRTTHKNELNNLLYHIRKILIQQNNLIPAVKALLLMTLDLYYSNFTSLTKQLEEMYTKYLVEEDKLNRTNIDEEKVNHDHNNDHNNPQQPEHPEQLNDIIENNIEIDDNNKKLLIIEQQQQNDDSLFNNIENNNSNNNDSFELPPISNKKWSEQVCEDSMFESELSLLQDNINFCGDNNNEDESLCYQSLPPQLSGSMLNDTSSSNLQQPLITKSPSQQQQDNNYNKHRLSSSSPRNEHSTTNNHYRSNHINNNNNQYNTNQNQSSHHWGQQQQQRNNNRHHNNNNYDDDRNSVRSEGGSIRLYSVGDRLRHAQSTATTSTPSSLHNSRNNQHQGGGRDNWDRGSGYHTYDGRRRSNSRNSNYENNTNNTNGGYRNNNNQQQQQNNRNNYDRPPRFSKNIESSWRNNTTQDPTTRSVSRGPDSRSSSRNRTTLPRPNRHSGSFENYNNSNIVGPGQPPPSVSPDGGVANNVGGNNQHRNNNNNRHYHKDNSGYNNRNTTGSGHFSHHNSNQQQQQNRQQSRNFGRSNNNNNQTQQQPHYPNNRYGSHNSLTSDTGTWERRGRPNNLRRNTRGKSQDWEDTRSVHGEPNNKWDEPSVTPTTIPTTRPDDDEQRICTNDDEITKNARNTTKYMQYLSQK